MKITKKGKIPSEEVKASCRYCGCEFTCNKSETKSSIWDQREGGWIHTITCPTCTKECFGYS